MKRKFLHPWLRNIAIKGMQVQVLCSYIREYYYMFSSFQFYLYKLGFRWASVGVWVPVFFSRLHLSCGIMWPWRRRGTFIIHLGLLTILRSIYPKTGLFTTKWVQKLQGLPLELSFTAWFLLQKRLMSSIASQNTGCKHAP